VACDGQGRLLIPAAQRGYASIDRDVVSIGALTRVEIWAKEQYSAHAAPEGEVAEFMADLGLF
jgi:MraZ protein